MAKRQQKLHSTKSRSLRMHVQDAVLQSKHLELREKLNFRSIFPYLNSHGLLPDSYDQTKLVDEKATVQQKIDDIITHLPKCGKEDYLNEFIECLRESEEGTGSAHLELAQSLEDAYTAKMEGPDLHEYGREGDHKEGTRSPESTSDSEQAVEQLEVQYQSGSVRSSTLEHPCEDETENNRHHRKLFYGCICGLLLALSVILLMAIIALGILSSVPKINQDPSIIRPLFAYGSSRSPLLMVDFGTDPFWIASAEFQVDDCNGAVLITDGEECLDLPISISENYDSSFHISYIYFLPGSTINITVQDEAAANTDLEVWRLNSEAWLQSDLGINLGSCDNPPPGSDCFFARRFSGKTVQQMIERADYYFFFINDSLSNDVQFTYAAWQYNLTAIHQRHRPVETTLTKDLSHTIAISNAFDFQQHKCILLDLSCSGAQRHRINISGVKKRMDVLIIPGVIGIFVILVVISVFSICILHIVWSNVKKRHQSR